MLVIAWSMSVSVGRGLSFSGAAAVMIIPHTLERTNLAGYAVGDQVNIETDLIGKYVARLLGGSAAPSGGVTLDLLAKSGFL